MAAVLLRRFGGHVGGEGVRLPRLRRWDPVQWPVFSGVFRAGVLWLTASKLRGSVVLPQLLGTDSDVHWARVCKGRPFGASSKGSKEVPKDICPSLEEGTSASEAKAAF